MNKEDYLKEIAEIKTIMNRSSRFISLSGLSGILAGIYAIIGAITAQLILTNYKNSSSSYSLLPISYLEYTLIVIALLVLLLSILSAYILSAKKAKKSGEKLWDATSKRLILNFSIPLFTGGAFCIVLYQNNLIGLIAPCTLIFYGLACLNASKYTLGDIRYLGLATIIIGLVSTQFIGYGLYFWAFGFGVMHIVYGAVLYNKYDKNIH
ncbi:hypothetical protein [Lutibacter sp. B1]|uniref:hypothetical protein n=1 Tax=Lutibacter sp. B1 TaxID=2725996 RepID=UPI0014563D66|nr:hypothetical protein [Lutibacter sp. B1]NLP58803.1 hypothetical protein [Lutibacter sp. B1]